ncbi:MAG: UDP-N-acetylmuramate dehydrogenase [Syntrophotaleaceae bacterium]
MKSAVLIEKQVNLETLNTFGLPARAAFLVRVTDEDDVRAIIADRMIGSLPRFILGGGSNVVFTGDLQALVLKVEVPGLDLLETRPDAWIVQAGAGESWHGLVEWTLARDLPGLENLALIPGTVGAAPVQNIGAYGLELADRFESLDIVELATGRTRTLFREDCRFGYRDSIFKRDLAGTCLITRVRLRLPRPWQPVLDYPDLARLAAESVAPLTPIGIFDRICSVRRSKLPDPAEIGSAGSFFKNPVISAAQFRALAEREPGIVHFSLPDGDYKLAAGWLIEACGWKGRNMGGAGVHDRQALVLVNRGQARGREVMALAAAIQESVFNRFGVLLEPEPIVLGGTDDLLSPSR